MDSAAPPKTVLGLAPSLQTPGFRLVDAGEMAALFQYMFAAGVVVPNGTTIATAGQIQGGVNVINSVAGGTAVKLPQALPGGIVWIINGTATAVTVFPFSAADHIMASLAITQVASVVLAASGVNVFVCVGPGLWKQVISA